MQHRLTALVTGFAFLALANSANAVIIDFESTPALATGPSLFANAGPAQDIVVGNVTISDGVVLGFPTYFPAIPFGTAPNVYGTAYHPSGGVNADPSLLSTLSITIDPADGVNTIEGLLFNGLIEMDSFKVEAFSASSLVDSVALNKLPSNLDEGFGVFRLDSGGSPIDLVTIAADLSGPLENQWDFAIDTIAINQAIETVVPVPAALPLLLTALGGLGLVRLGKKRQAEI